MELAAVGEYEPTAGGTKTNLVPTNAYQKKTRHNRVFLMLFYYPKGSKSEAGCLHTGQM